MRTVKTARLDAIANWFLEASVLLAVFPWLDQVVHVSSPFNWRLFFWCIGLVLLFMTIGLYLIRGDE